MQIECLQWGHREQIWPSNFKIFLIFWKIVIPGFQHYTSAVACLQATGTLDTLLLQARKKWSVTL